MSESATTGHRAVSESQPLIVVEDLVATYGDETVLEGIDFMVYPGEIFVILGGSGCGKSTLMKHMIGLYKPARGRVLIEGEDITRSEGPEKDRILRRIGVLYQSSALFSSMTLRENIALPLEEFTSLEREQIDILVRMKLQLVDMAGSEEYYPSQLSGGMRKRAALARAMALDPEILFFDEPSAGLDPITLADLDALILQINATLGTTMVVVTHELSSIMTIAKRAIMLDRATKSIIGQGDPSELKDHHPNPKVREFFNPRKAAEIGPRHREPRAKNKIVT